MNGRKFAVFDIDGTLIRWQLYHAVADELAKHGHFEEHDYKAIKEARMTWKKRDNQDSFAAYEKVLIGYVNQVLVGMPVRELEAACQTVIGEYKDQVYTYTRNLIRELKSQNFLLFTISASPREIVKLLANYYGFDDYGGSEYEIINGRYTSRKILLKRERKPEFLQQLVAKHNATYEGSVAVGDSESDIPMLEVVKKPIAFNPTKLLFEHAEEKGWKIVVERKNVIYEMENSDGTYRLQP